jgi:DNA-binding response OmpR family regulator
MATHGEIRWPSVGSFDGRLWGDSHGRRQRKTEAGGEPQLIHTVRGIGYVLRN